MVTERISERDVGSYWLFRDGKVWELISYCPYPTAVWRSVGDREQRKSAAVGSELALEFRRLVLDADVDALREGAEQ